MKTTLLTLLGSLPILTSAVSAQTLESINFSPLEGTSWSSGDPVRLYFGQEHGMGTVTISSVNGGSFSNALTPYSYNLTSPYNGPTTLSDGRIFAPTSESVFSIVSNPSSSDLSGFSITVQLDSGSFAPGSVFSLRSLGTRGNSSQYFQPGAGIGSPDSVALPTDAVNPPALVLVDSVNNLYAPASNTAASAGLAFNVSGNSFTGNFLSTAGYQPGGVAFTIAVPQAIPEPSAAMLLLPCAAFAFRRRRQH